MRRLAMRPFTTRLPQHQARRVISGVGRRPHCGAAARQSPIQRPPIQRSRVGYPVATHERRGGRGVEAELPAAAAASDRLHALSAYAGRAALG